jgi:hypothetical protein
MLDPVRCLTLSSESVAHGVAVQQPHGGIAPRDHDTAKRGQT